MSLENRLRCLWDLKEIGYQVGCGFMVGAPGQNAEHLAKELLFIRTLEPHMVGIGPFIPQKDTPFGKETAGLPTEFTAQHPARCVRLPMRPGQRCLNLSNAVAVTVYDVLRQGEFAGLQEVGKLGGCPSP